MFTEGLFHYCTESILVIIIKLKDKKITGLMQKKNSKQQTIDRC